MMYTLHNVHGAPPTSICRAAIPQDEALLDDVIDRLLEVRGARPGKAVSLTEQEIRQLCFAAKEVFMSQPNLLELEAPIKICGKYWSSLLLDCCRCPPPEGPPAAVWRPPPPLAAAPRQGSTSTFSVIQAAGILPSPPHPAYQPRDPLAPLVGLRLHVPESRLSKCTCHHRLDPHVPPRRTAALPSTPAPLAQRATKRSHVSPLA